MKLGTTELLVLLAVVLIVFGPTQIPKLTKMFGKSIRGFREGLDAEDKDSDSRVGSDEKEKQM